MGGGGYADGSSPHARIGRRGSTHTFATQEHGSPEQLKRLARPTDFGEERDFGEDRRILVKIGFYTSTFNDRPLEEVVDFAASARFDAIEIDVGGHIKTPDRVEAAVALARSRDLFVSRSPISATSSMPTGQNERHFGKGPPNLPARSGKRASRSS